MKSGSTPTSKHAYHSAPLETKKYFENLIPFSVASSSQLSLVAFLGVANLLGVDAISTMMKSPRNAFFFTHFPGSLLKKVSSLLL
jgi:hypothetical protein